MQSIANIIRELALLISALTAGLTAWNALKKLKHDNDADDKDQLRADRDLYRQRWLESEKGYNELDKKYDKLNAENDRLEDKIRRLERQKDDGH